MLYNLANYCLREVFSSKKQGTASPKDWRTLQNRKSLIAKKKKMLFLLVEEKEDQQKVSPGLKKKFRLIL